MEGIRRPEAQPQPERKPIHIDTIAQELSKARKAVAILLQRLSPDLIEAYAYELQRISAFASDFIAKSRAKVSEPNPEEIENEIRESIIPWGRKEIGITDLIAYIRDCLANAATHRNYLVEGSTLRNDLKPLEKFIQFLNILLNKLKKSQ
jgi:hypothetical protein